MCGSSGKSYFFLKYWQGRDSVFRWCGYVCRLCIRKSKRAFRYPDRRRGICYRCRRSLLSVWTDHGWTQPDRYRCLQFHWWLCKRCGQKAWEHQRRQGNRPYPPRRYCKCPDRPYFPGLQTEWDLEGHRSRREGKTGSLWFCIWWRHPPQSVEDQWSGTDRSHWGGICGNSGYLYCRRTSQSSFRCKGRLKTQGRKPWIYRWRAI